MVWTLDPRMVDLKLSNSILLSQLTASFFHPPGYSLFSVPGDTRICFLDPESYNPPRDKQSGWLR